MKLCCSIPLLVQIYQSDIQIRYALSVLVFTRIFTCTIGVYWDIYVYYWCVLGYLPVLLVCTGIFTCIIGVYWDIYLYYWFVLGSHRLLWGYLDTTSVILKNYNYYYQAFIETTGQVKYLRTMVILTIFHRDLVEKMRIEILFLLRNGIL